MQQAREDRRERALAAAVGGRTRGGNGRQSCGGSHPRRREVGEDSQRGIWRWVAEGGDYGNGEPQHRVGGREGGGPGAEAVIRKPWIVHLNSSVTALRWLVVCGRYGWMFVV